LPDAGKLQEEEAAFANKKKYSKHQPALPLYTRADAERCLSQFTTVQMGSEFQLRNNLKVKLIPSGHILGATFVVMDDGSRTLTFSGDLGRPNDLMIRPPKEIHSTDYLVIESTYGDREHPKVDLLDQMDAVIKRTVERGGTLVIPAFSVGRCQALIYCLYLLKKQKRIPEIPIFLDSPMSIEATRIFCNHVGEHRLNQEQCAESANIVHYVPEQKESKLLDQRRDPMLIISASGMATGGRVLHHLKRFLPEEKNTIVLTGYQAEGTRGAALLRGEKLLKLLGEEVPVRAEIANIENLSAHADQGELFSWLSKFHRAPKRVFITHGEKGASLKLKEVIEQKLKWSCVVPEYGQKEDLQ
jgi:metallo-beta-lactamase family protein